MNRIHRRDSMPMLLAAGTTLLLVSLWSAAAYDAVAGAPVDGLSPLMDEPVPSSDANPPRRLNSSLSMPYFSFAQSLNPRS